MNDKRNTVSLVLGSGGARGLAHIGVIHVLEERGYDIRSVSGCSVGAACSASAGVVSSATGSSAGGEVCATGSLTSS